MEVGVAYYRLYFLDHEDRIADAAELDCDTDEQAVAEGQDHAAGRRFDIWQEERWVGVFDPSKPAIDS
jgi:hypothetical protein